MTDWKKKLSDNIDRQEKLLGMLGLAMRAGKLIVGTDQVFTAMQKASKPYLVFVSEGASDKAKERIGFKCEFYNVPLAMLKLPPEELGRRLGKTYTPVCVGVSDEGFAKRLKELAAPDSHNT
jgi:ribosomal protein L7Ae-like RNA K-turn-binding protein